MSHIYIQWECLPQCWWRWYEAGIKMKISSFLLFRRTRFEASYCLLKAFLYVHTYEIFSSSFCLFFLGGRGMFMAYLWAYSTCLPENYTERDLLLMIILILLLFHTTCPFKLVACRFLSCGCLLIWFYIREYMCMRVCSYGYSIQNKCAAGAAFPRILSLSLSLDEKNPAVRQFVNFWSKPGINEKRGKLNEKSVKQFFAMRWCSSLSLYPLCIYLYYASYVWGNDILCMNIYIEFLFCETKKSYAFCTSTEWEVKKKV